MIRRRMRTRRREGEERIRRRRGKRRKTRRTGLGEEL
jgi:hypothetical protein